MSAVAAALKVKLFKLGVHPARHFGIALIVWMQSVCGHPLGVMLDPVRSARNKVGTDVGCRGLDPAADNPERLRSLIRVPEWFDCDEPGRGKGTFQPREVDVDPAVNLCGGSIVGKVVVESTRF